MAQEMSSDSKHFLLRPEYGESSIKIELIDISPSILKKNDFFSTQQSASTKSLNDVNVLHINKTIVEKSSTENVRSISLSRNENTEFDLNAIEDCAGCEVPIDSSQAKVKLSYRDSSAWTRIAKETYSTRSCSCCPGACSTLKEGGHVSSRIDIMKSLQEIPSTVKPTCDACILCSDVCTLISCSSCLEKKEKYMITSKSKKTNLFSRCQVKRHNTKESCWVVVDKTVYDVTLFLSEHPAGIRCILKHSGGKDCTEAFGFHSTHGRKLWESYKIGKLIECGQVEETSGCRVM